ncbi:MAG TPA: rhomboid-like protein [Aldersonia sp.]
MGLREVTTYVGRAPGTYVWLAALLVTTAIMNHLTESELRRLLGERSTNLHHLAEDPLHVLISSAFWIDGGSWFSYFVLFNLFHVPAERWLGTLRWLGVVVLAHVGATYLSEGVLYWAIQHGDAPARAVNTLDVGVSYALAGVVAVLTYRIARPWRWWYLMGVLAVYAAPLVLSEITFTEVGHFSAVLIGLACYPLTWSRPGPWNPMTSVSAEMHRLRAQGSSA